MLKPASPETMKVFLLHGLGASWKSGLTLAPLQLYLRHVAGFECVERITYPADSADFERCLDCVDRKLAEFADKAAGEPIAVVGHSFGGVVANNLHRRGWRIETAIYVGSPLRGARVIDLAESLLPACVADLFRKPPYEFLQQKAAEEPPPHPYWTVSMGWFWTGFDHCVHRDEATLDPTRNVHLPWADHATIVLNPRFWWLVRELLQAERV